MRRRSVLYTSVQVPQMAITPAISRPVIEVSGVRKTTAPPWPRRGRHSKSARARSSALSVPTAPAKTTTMECIEGLRSLTAATSAFSSRPVPSSYKLQDRIALSFSRRSCKSESRSGRPSTSGPRLPEESHRLRPLARATRLTDKPQRLVHEPLRRTEAAPVIALALINDPEVVFLDELTTDSIRNRVTPSGALCWHPIAQNGLLTTHLMEEASASATGVAIMSTAALSTSTRQHAWSTSTARANRCSGDGA